MGLQLNYKNTIMCCRFTLATPTHVIYDYFGIEHGEVEVLDDFTPRYNIAPSQKINVVGLKPDGIKRGLIKIDWGFLPHFAESADYKNRYPNCRGETVHRLPSFQESFRTKRCLIPADGFYEWETVGRQKLPFHFQRLDKQLFAFAGIWDIWRDGKSTIFSTCLITTEPNELVRPIHNRMPVMLAKNQFEAWLSHDSESADLQKMLQPFPASEMNKTAVTQKMNSAKFEGPDCLNERIQPLFSDAS